jgi:hypothetical protein
MDPNNQAEEGSKTTEKEKGVPEAESSERK